MTTPIAVDTSVATALLVETHAAHPVVVAWASGRQLVLSGHAAVETYSVLTRLPGDLRVAPGDAVTLIDENFLAVVPLSAGAAVTIHRRLADLGIAGGAVYDALVACAAWENGLALATRDIRARGTYDAVGVSVVLVA